MKIAIIGGGIGGLSAALHLLKAGLDVHVYEQSPRIGEIGAGIQISPNASRLLIRLGLKPALDAVGVRPGAVAASHRLHDDVEERHGLLAAFVETGDDRGVPGAAAGGLDILAQLQGLVQHAGQALGDQAAGEPRRADRAAADRGREGGVVEGAFLGDQVEAVHQAAC